VPDGIGGCQHSESIEISLGTSSQPGMDQIVDR
jgi:hypothetical protein